MISHLSLLKQYYWGIGLKRGKRSERERERKEGKKKKKNKEGIPRSISLARKSHITPKKTKKQK